MCRATYSYSAHRDFSEPVAVIYQQYSLLSSSTSGEEEDVMRVQWKYKLDSHWWETKPSTYPHLMLICVLIVGIHVLKWLSIPYLVQKKGTI